MIGKTGRGDRRLEYALITLRDLGVIEPTSVEDRYRFVRRLEPDEPDAAEMEEKKRRDLMRLLDVVKMVQTEDVQSFVLDYFDL